MATKSIRSNRVLRVSRKYKLVMAFGGRCQVCKYDKNISSLVFHHKDEKTMALNGSQLSAYALNKIEEEASKCTLMCQNCHNELHNPQLEMKNVSKAITALDNKIMTRAEAEQYFFQTEDS